MEEFKMAPHSEVAERSVLSACLNKGAFPDVCVILRPEDFYLDVNQRIFAAMVELDRLRKPLDLPIVFDWLVQNGHGHDVRLDYIAELHAAYVGHDFKAQAELVRVKAVSRELLNICHQIEREVYSPTMAESDNLDYAERLVFELGQRRQGIGQSVSVVKAVNDAFDRMDTIDEAIRNGRPVLFGVPSGFPSIDKIMNGWKQSELTIIGARTSVGKTSIGVNFFAHAFCDKRKALFFTLEMSASELADKLISMKSHVNPNTIRNGKATADDKAKLALSFEIFQDVRSWINDSPRMTASQIFSIARRQKAQTGLDLVVVDYLQLIEPDNRHEQRYMQIGNATRLLKMLSKELSVPVVVMAQLGREADGQKPKLSDLRESGNIEQDADNVLLLHRQGEAHNLSASGVTIEVIIAKQRSGVTGELELIFQPQFSLFKDPGVYP